MSASSTASPPDALAALFDEYKYGPGKNMSIVRSSSAIVSVAASALLVRILFRRHGMKTTYHRLLLGLSVSDILCSSSMATFGAVVPSELNYAVWNARGSRASCDAFGFVLTLGLCSGLVYMCSLNLYYVAKIKFNKTESYIAKKLEPWLHGVPALYGVIVSIVILAKQGMNAGIDGSCNAANTHEPPHCDEYEDGDIPEGFEIPCGRGRRAEPISWVTALVTVFFVPIIIGGSLWTIYRSVSRAERRIARYGAGALQTSRIQPAISDGATIDVEGGGGGGRRASLILAAVSSRLGGRAARTDSDNQDSSQSRAVLQKAAAYSIAYFMTYVWAIIYSFLVLAGAWRTETPQPKWQIAFEYVWYFFAPLQGLWMLLIFMQPNVIKRRRSSDGNVSWFRAFADALWSAVTGRTNPARRGRDQTSSGAPRTDTDHGSKGRNPSATVRSTYRQSDRALAESMGLDAEDHEEDKGEVQEYEPSV